MKKAKNKTKKPTIIDYKLYPTKSVRFVETGWPVHAEDAGMQVDYAGRAICIEFGKKPTIRIWSKNKNGDLDQIVYEKAL